MGNLPNNDMYNQVMKLLKPACPDPKGPGASCDSGGKSIDPMQYLPKDGETTEAATITFTIEDSKYDTTEQRDAMLGAAVQAFTSAATKDSCKSEQVNHCEGGMSEPNEPNDVNAPGPHCFTQMSFCDTANLVSVTISDGGKTVAYMHVESAFKMDGIVNSFDCALIVAVVGSVLEVAAPELSADIWAALGDIEAVCDEAGL